MKGLGKFNNKARVACKEGKWKELGFPNFAKCAHALAPKSRKKERAVKLHCPTMPKSADARLALAAKMERCPVLADGPQGVLKAAEAAESYEKMGNPFGRRRRRRKAQHLGRKTRKHHRRSHR